jgi:hypothetical protein
MGAGNFAFLGSCIFIVFFSFAICALGREEMGYGIEKWIVGSGAYTTVFLNIGGFDVGRVNHYILFANRVLLRYSEWFELSICRSRFPEGRVVMLFLV